MNYIKLLAGFFEKASDDDKLNPTHISMYMALFQFWNINHFQNPISISRNQVMKVSKICSFATYHKCIRELNEYGYLRYLPSYNPYKGSLITLFDLAPDMEDLTFENVKSLSRETTLRVDCYNLKNEPKNEGKTDFNHTNNQTGNPQNEEEDTKNQSGESPENEVIHTKIQTGCDDFNPTKIQPSPVQALVPSINVINVIKEKNIYIKEIEIFKNEIPEKKFLKEEEKKEKCCAKKEQEKRFDNLPPICRVKVSSLFGVIPTLKDVVEYFIFKNIAPLEAERFFNYYESNGWLIGGKTKMKNWNAAASNWMLNFTKFNFDRKVPIVANPLHVLKIKNYNEPL